MANHQGQSNLAGCPVFETSEMVIVIVSGRNRDPGGSGRGKGSLIDSFWKESFASSQWQMAIRIQDSNISLDVEVQNPAVLSAETRIE